MTKATAASTHDPPIGPSTACPPRAVAARVAAYAQASGNGPAAWEGRDELCLLRPVCSRTTSHDAGRSLSVSTVRCLCRRASARAAQSVSQASRTEAERDVRKTKAGMYRGRRPVLIGVEGSVSAQGALAWAAAEASCRHCPLQIVHAFTLPTMGNPVDLTVPPVSTGNHAGAEWLLGEAESHVRRAAPGVKVTAELFVAGAAPTLLSQAQNAELMVVGGRELGGLRGLLVGSASATLAAHAPCPVSVVHPQRDGAALPDSHAGPRPPSPRRNLRPRRTVARRSGTIARPPHAGSRAPGRTRFRVRRVRRPVDHA